MHSSTWGQPRGLQRGDRQTNMPCQSKLAKHAWDNIQPSNDNEKNTVRGGSKANCQLAGHTATPCHTVPVPYPLFTRLLHSASRPFIQPKMPRSAADGTRRGYIRSVRAKGAATVTLCLVVTLARLGTSPRSRSSSLLSTNRPESLLLLLERMAPYSICSVTSRH